ncbi:MAG: T9SS type A sorting domain-containing protein [Paludibacteraceae bacterium]|nr:T9SS type A sorting domain-containing protein [Paludibacteraceae bacterium]
MRNKITALVLSILFIIPCALRAEEVEIQLMEVIEMGVIPGDSPFDDPIQSPGVPPSPTSFRATINGNAFSLVKRSASIPSAQATVVNASTGNVVLNQQFSNSVQHQIATPGVYILHIQTANGALTGQFVVQ